MRKSKLYSLVIILLAAFICLPSPSLAQKAELEQITKNYVLDSGVHRGETGLMATSRVAFSDVISVSGVSWIRLKFSEANLGRESYITITSREDGAQQILNATTLAQWQNTSAYFNGDAVEVALHVAPNEKGIQVKMEELWVGQDEGPDSQCGPTDDRVPSDDPATGRLLTVGCTGWIIDNGLHVTAGHCSGGSATVLQFNVPLSSSTGSLNHPGPEDQYSVDASSKIAVNGGVGNDWGVFKVFDNSVTGLQPIEAQGASFTVVQDLGPPEIRITGYGVDFNDPTLNQVQQTHVGPNAGSSGTTMRYVTDTEGGNSGSPVIDDATGNAVGVHTHGGCSTTGSGNNNGTSTFNSAFWDALNPPSLTLTPINPPITIPPTGGSFQYEVEITNNSSSAQSFSFWTLVQFQNGSQTDPLFGPVPVDLDPGQTVSATLTQNVPPVDPATFTYIGRVGTFPTPVNASSSFVFTVTSSPTTTSISDPVPESDWSVTVTEGAFTVLAETQAENSAIPGDFALGQNYPNPFNPSTTISYRVSEDTPVRITIYDLMGREVRELVNEHKSGGTYHVTWNGLTNTGSQVASGVYLYKMEAGDFVQTRKLILAK